MKQIRFTDRVLSVILFVCSVPSLTCNPGAQLFMEKGPIVTVGWTAARTSKNHTK